MLRAVKITLGSLETAKANIKSLGGTVVYERQESRMGGGVIAHLTVEGDPTEISKILDLLIGEQLESFTEFGPGDTMTGNVTYRVAAPGDEIGILLVFAEVAPEVPTRIYPRTRRKIEDLVATDMSWVAVDADDMIVGYALAEGDKKMLLLGYLGVSKAARNQHISTTLVSKLQENGAPIFTDVRPDNKSSMVERFERFGFVKIPNEFTGTRLRWDKKNPPA